MQSKIRVLVAEDHAFLRLAIRQVLGGGRDIDIVEEVVTGQDALARAGDGDVDVLVLNVSLPGLSGLEVFRRLEQSDVRVAIVFMSAYPEDQFALSLLREGAAAYLSKDAEPDELLTAVRRAAEGLTYLTNALLGLSRRHDGRSPVPHNRLSVREHQVFMQLIEGQTVSLIAAELDLSVSTVSNYVGRIRGKLGVESQGEIFRYAHRAGLLDCYQAASR